VRSPVSLEKWRETELHIYFNLLFMMAVDENYILPLFIYTARVCLDETIYAEYTTPNSNVSYLRSISDHNWLELYRCFLKLRNYQRLTVPRKSPLTNEIRLQCSMAPHCIPLGNYFFCEVFAMSILAGRVIFRLKFPPLALYFDCKLKETAIREFLN
jgi:hypothetical protein